MARPLTARQEAFCLEYVARPNGKAAAVAAGYSEKAAEPQASRLLRTAKVQDRLAELRAGAGEQAQVTAAYVLTRLRENVERAMTVAPVVDRDGNPTGEYRYDGAVANRALELLGKHLGLFADRLQIGGDPASPPVKNEHTLSGAIDHLAAAFAAAADRQGAGGLPTDRPG